MPVRTSVEQNVTAVCALIATRIADATVATGDDFDVRTYPHGSRFLLVLDALETDATNTGGTWTVVESETDGGSYTACTTSGSLAATPATAGNAQRVVSLIPNGDKPFVHVVYTPAGAGTDVDVTATLIVLPAAMV